MARTRVALAGSTGSIGTQSLEVIEAVPPEDILSINTPEDLAEVDRIYRSRTAGAATSEVTR